MKELLLTAQCRARCFQQNSNSCNDLPCTTCWHFCSKGHHSKLQLRYTDKDDLYSFSSLPILSESCHLTWKPAKEADSRLVFLIIGKDKKGQLYQVAQTWKHNVQADQILCSKLVDMRVVAVAPQGISSSKVVLKEKEEKKDTELLTSEQLLPIVLMKHAGKMTIATLYWQHLWKTSPEDSFESPRFLVTWEDETNSGLVMGSVTTHRNKITLSLLPDTNYILRVKDLVSGNLSRPVYINTFRVHGHSYLPLILVLISLSCSLAMLTAIFCLGYRMSFSQLIKDCTRWILHLLACDSPMSIL